MRCCVYIEPVKRHVELQLNVTTCTYKIETAAGNGVVKAEMDLFNYAWGKYRKPIFLTKDFEQIFALLVSELKKWKVLQLKVIYI